MITSLSVTRPLMRGVLTLNDQSRDGSDAWCTHLPANPTGYLPTHPYSMNAATHQQGLVRAVPE
jgi:hypothetical protein